MRQQTPHLGQQAQRSRRHPLDQPLCKTGAKGAGLACTIRVGLVCLAVLSAGVTSGQGAWGQPNALPAPAAPGAALAASGQAPERVAERAAERAAERLPDQFPDQLRDRAPEGSAELSLQPPGGPADPRLILPLNPEPKLGRDELVAL